MLALFLCIYCEPFERGEFVNNYRLLILFLAFKNLHQQLLVEVTWEKNDCQTCHFNMQAPSGNFPLLLPLIVNG